MMLSSLMHKLNHKHDQNTEANVDFWKINNSLIFGASVSGCLHMIQWYPCCSQLDNTLSLV